MTDITNETFEQNMRLENLPNEIWKDILGYETLYQISNHGRVKSLEKNRIKNRDSLKINTQIKKLYINKGYVIIMLCKNGIKKSHKLHRLVAQNFIANPNNYEQVNHKNLLKYDNRVENLEWCDHTYNQRHARAIRPFKRPPGNPKITLEQAREIIRLNKKENYSREVLSKMFNMSTVNIGHIIRGLRWKDAQLNYE